MTARTAAQHSPAELRYTGCTEDREVVFFQAESASQPGRVNEVAYDRVARATYCDCKGAENGRHCWHMDLAPQAFVEEVARQYVARLATLAEVEAVGRQARARIDACQGLWALVSPLDRAIYQAARVAWHERAALAAPALALAA